ncbi:MAG: hypothetical protein JZU49_03335 [Sulfuricurvum sp.]|nr:hypothetical protein [Sulfuricurvum sp.]
MNKSDILTAHYLLNGNQPKGINPISFATVKSTKLSYAKFKNMPKLKAEAEAIENTIKEIAPERYTELKDEIIVCVTPLNKDSKSPKEASQIELDWIQNWEKKEEWKEQSEAYEKLVDEFVNQDMDLELHKVNLADLPEDLTDLQFKAISIFLAD